MALLALLSGCGTLAMPNRSDPVSFSVQPASSEEGLGLRDFATVIETIVPVAERECRALTRRVSCDLLFAVDLDQAQPPNAFQTYAGNVQPLIIFTAALIHDARNLDELAFVVGHEAAHHIAGHIERQRQNAVDGGAIGVAVAAVRGSDPKYDHIARYIGARANVSAYSKRYELEADALGTVIAARAGFDPLRGAEFFTRIPDPGNRFLGTHPPNAERIATVRRVAAGL
jgi:predicted Zn-dependent protease